MRIVIGLLITFTITAAVDVTPLHTVPFTTSALGHSSYGLRFARFGKGNCEAAGADDELDARYTDNHVCASVSECYLNKMQGGETIEYEIQSPNNVRVDVNVTVASKSPGTEFITFILDRMSERPDDVEAPGEGWQAFKNIVSVRNAHIPAGKSRLRVQIVQGKMNFCALGTTITETIVPDLDGILAEHFQASHLLVPTRKPKNPGKRNRVRTKKRGWLEYNIFAEYEKDYKIATRIGSRFPGKKFRVEVDGKKVTGRINVPNKSTEKLIFEEVVAVSKMRLEPGRHKVRVIFEKKKIVLDKLMVRFSEEPKKFDVALVATQFASCTIGTDCPTPGDEGCIALIVDLERCQYELGNVFMWFLDDDSLKSVGFNSSLRSQQYPGYKEFCQSYNTYLKYTSPSFWKGSLSEKVKEWSVSEIELDFHEIEITGSNIGMDRHDNFFYPGPQSMQEHIEAKLDFVPDFIFVFQDQENGSRWGKKYRYTTCNLTSAGDAGVAGAGYTWVGVDDEYGRCDYIDGDDLFEYWLAQVKWAYENISPLKPFDGTWESGVKLVANHCKDGIQNYGETAVDSGGPCLDI